MLPGGAIGHRLGQSPGYLSLTPVRLWAENDPKCCGLWPWTISALALAFLTASENLVFPASLSVQLLSINWGTMKGYPIATPLTPVQVGKESSGPVSRTWNPGWDNGPVQWGWRQGGTSRLQGSGDRLIL